MKVGRIFVERNIKSFRDLFREGATRGWGYRLSDGKNVYMRELIYYSIKGFEDGIDFILLTVCFEVLQRGQTFLIPRDYTFNKLARRLVSYVYQLKELGIVGVKKVDTPNSSFYRWIKQITDELASNFKEIGRRLEELEKEYIVDTSYLRYEGINYDDIKSGKQLPSDRDIDILERFFGSKIIPRWRSVRYFENLLYNTCEKILEGWRENKKLEQFIKEEGINVPDKFTVRIKSPRDLLVDSYLTCDEIITSLIGPSSFREIKDRLGHRFYPHSILSILNSYGIVGKRGNKYELKSLDAFKIALSKLSKRMERYRKFIKTLQLSTDGKSMGEISRFLGIPLPVVHYWIKLGRKPLPISHHTAELLYRGGVISREELGTFKTYGLIR